ncbi:CBS domain-containing protein [Parvularcula oceani]|uniref:CBS domain-containing protein n=1 Tax=Parvularcula oceani TaxID=1247963 RepID=UPI00055ACC16|nr:CBS domain-containing protein [Parvularcula oceani]
MRVIDVMQRSVPTCGPGASALEAARLLREEGAGLLVVVEDGRPAGVLTDRDLVLKVMAEGLDPSAVMVGTLMSAPVITCQPTEDIAPVVLRLEADGVRRCPVLSAENQVIGLLSVDDVNHTVARTLSGELRDVLGALRR